MMEPGSTWSDPFCLRKLDKSAITGRGILIYSQSVQTKFICGAKQNNRPNEDFFFYHVVIRC